MLRLTLGTTAALAAAAGMMALAQPSKPALKAVDLQAEPESHPPLVQWTGHETKRKEKGYLLVHDETAWTALWSEHTGTDLKKFDVMTRHAAPKIDFGRCLVIAFFRGDTTNEDAEPAEAVQEYADHIRLRYEPATFQTAGSDARGGAADTRPFGIWVLPVTTKPIVLEEGRRELLNEPVKWHEVKRFEGAARGN